jgi:hypothetical protein
MVLVGAAPSVTRGPALGGRQPRRMAVGHPLSCDHRRPWVAGGRYAAKRSPFVDRRGQVQAYGTCLQNEHESAPDLVRRSGSRPPPGERVAGRPLDDARRASVPMRQAAPRRVTASSVARPRGARPSMPDRCYTDVVEIRTPPALPARCSAFNGGPHTTASQWCQLVSAAAVPEAGDMPNDTCLAPRG